jgi:hypothetical protein
VSPALIRARATPFSPCRAPFRSLVGEQLIVDAFARYRVIDPLKYYQTVGAQLAILLNAALRRVLRAATLTDVVRDKPRCLISDYTLMSGLGLQMRKIVAGPARCLSTPSSIGRGSD